MFNDIGIKFDMIYDDMMFTARPCWVFCTRNPLPRPGLELRLEIYTIMILVR